MPYSTLSASGLRYSDPGDSDWNVNVFIYNVTRLNNTLLKLTNLLNVDVSGIVNGELLAYNTSTSKWEPDSCPSTGRWLSTTTTTSSSTTTSTTN